MSKHTCESIRVLIPDYLDGKLVASDEERVRQHVTSCPACADEVEQLRPLMQNMLPTARDEKANVDWTGFSVALHEKIDRRHRQSRFFSGRSAVLIPVAAAVLVAIALWFFLRADDQMTETVPAYAVRIAQEDVGDIAPEEFAGISLEDITISGIADEDALFMTRPTESSIILEDSIATTELRDALVDDLGFETLVAATLEYFSTDDVIDAISDDDAALLASALEIQDISLP